MQPDNDPGTSNSYPHIRATFSQPNCRAAKAGNSAFKSRVVVKMALATSSCRMSFCRIISAKRLDRGLENLLTGVRFRGGRPADSSTRHTVSPCLLDDYPGKNCSPGVAYPSA